MSFSVANKKAIFHLQHCHPMFFSVARKKKAIFRLRHLKKFGMACIGTRLCYAMFASRPSQLFNNNYTCRTLQSQESLGMRLHKQQYHGPGFYIHIHKEMYKTVFEIRCLESGHTLRIFRQKAPLYVNIGGVLWI